MPSSSTGWALIAGALVSSTRVCGVAAEGVGRWNVEARETGDMESFAMVYSGGWGKGVCVLLL
jgi:hypothetical protein